jgi:hypothetical protein
MTFRLTYTLRAHSPGNDHYELGKPESIDLRKFRIVEIEVNSNELKEIQRLFPDLREYKDSSERFHGKEALAIYQAYTQVGARL